MSASKKPRQEPDEALFEEPDYDKFTDEQLDALYRGESIDSVKKQPASRATGPVPSATIGEAANDDLLPDELGPELERELLAELDMDDEDLIDDEDWDTLDDDEFNAP